MLSVNNLTKSKVPKVPFSDIAKKILNSKYDLSLVFVGDARSRNLNKKYRAKDKVANVLSFPYEKNSGEIFLNLNRTKTEAKKFDHNFDEHLCFLFIHGLLHLKGMDHSSKMESTEQRILKLFFNDKKHSHGVRHRNDVDSTRGLRMEKRRN